MQESASVWDRTNSEERAKFSKHAALSALQLGEWDNMQQFSSGVKGMSHGDFFCQAALALHHNDTDTVLKVVHKARCAVDEALVTLGPGSNEYNDPEAQYFRVYKTVVRLQRLTELEEAVRGIKEPEYRSLMKQAWEERLRGMTPSAEVWQRSRAVHCLVLSPKENIDMELMFVGLCRQTGRKHMAERTLLRLCIQTGCAAPVDHPDPRVQVNCLTPTRALSAESAVIESESIEQREHSDQSDYSAAWLLLSCGLWW